MHSKIIIVYEYILFIYNNAYTDDKETQIT